jgi:hypothetical protein
MASSRDPAKKKRLSYERDGRSIFGQNDKASRRLVPLRKRWRARAERRRVNQQLAPGALPQSLGEDEHLQAEIAPSAKRGWCKGADVRLGEAIEVQRRRREDRAAPPGAD